MLKRVNRPNPIVAANWARRCYGGEFPQSPMRIAKNMGIAVTYGSLPANRPGYLLTVGNNRRAILLSRDNSYERQRWTCAHELGHYVMHRYMGEYFAHTPGDKSPAEKEANKFAAQLLMPEGVVRSVAAKLSFGGLAAYFGVSLQAMHVRLTELGVECR